MVSILAMGSECQKWIELQDTHLVSARERLDEEAYTLGVRSYVKTYTHNVNGQAQSVILKVSSYLLVGRVG